MVNIIPAELFHTSINNKCFCQGIYAPSHSQILYLVQLAGEMSNSHMYKSPQNNIYSYNIIAQFEKGSDFRQQRKKLFKDWYIHQGVNESYGSKKWKVMLGKKIGNIRSPPHSKNLYLRHLKNQNQMKITRGQNLKKFNNTAGLSVFFCNEFIK